MKVWIAVVEHHHGQNVYAARTREGVIDQLYDYVLLDEPEVPSSKKKTPLTTKQKRNCIDCYFEKRIDEEWLETITWARV